MVETEHDQRTAMQTMTAPRDDFSQYIHLRLLVVGAMLVLSSCANTGSREKTDSAVVVPSAWQRGTTSSGTLDTAALASWWERFNDPVLNELMADTLRSSPDVGGQMEGFVSSTGTEPFLLEILLGSYKKPPISTGP